MARELNLADIQGNVLRAYGLPKARYLFLNIQDSPDGRIRGRAFVDALRPRITTALPWKSKENYPGSPSGGDLPPKPKATLNIAFSFWGLAALGLPTKTLQSMPDEFIEGMKSRARLLGDDFKSSEEIAPSEFSHWDPIWRIGEKDKQVHILISINAQMQPDGLPVPEMQEATNWVLQLCQESGGGVRVLSGHGRDGTALYQDSSALLAHDRDGNLKPTPKEPFGYTDGFGDPVFDGQYPEETEQQEAIGGGKILPDQTWAPLATGEFLLGYPDEAQEVPPASMPLELTRNGTFMAYRKLHQNVASFNAYLNNAAIAYAKVQGISDPDEARETIKAKVVGRWSDGVPLLAAPTFSDWRAFQDREAAAKATGDKAAIDAIEQSYIDFKYRTDPRGAVCPVTAHMRRANTRDALDPTGISDNPKDWNGSILNNRRRILRRGLPYGKSTLSKGDEPEEQGIIFIALCASLFRQFEFVQQQWMQYGLDFDAGNDTCPLVGNHGSDAKFVIPGDANSKTRPFICARLPQFVEVRGGEYFFIPSMTALGIIGMGTTDPT